MKLLIQSNSSHKKKIVQYIAVLMVIIMPMAAQAAKPIVSDSRIKTLVYSPNEVFGVTVHYGYQSYIEFGPDEKIEAYSLGDSTPWRIATAGNRMFITPIDGYSHTNMNVITSRRSYTFDLESKIAPEEEADINLTYVLRFYYPDDSFDQVELIGEELESKKELPMEVNEDFNFNYSLVGPDNIAPTKVFDDGKVTFFEFPDQISMAPSISVIDFNGNESSVRTRKQGKFIVVERIAGQFALRFSQNLVCIFNENNYDGSGTI